MNIPKWYSRSHSRLSAYDFTLQDIFHPFLRRVNFQERSNFCYLCWPRSKISGWQFIFASVWLLSTPPPPTPLQQPGSWVPPHQNGPLGALTAQQPISNFFHFLCIIPCSSPQDFSASWSDKPIQVSKWTDANSLWEWTGSSFLGNLIAFY